MEQTEETLFEAFKRNVKETLVPYLSDFNFPADDYIQEGPQWINARFVRGETALVVSASMHEDDASKGMTVTLNTPDGDLHLRDEVEREMTEQFPVYFFSTEVMDAEFKRLVRDIKKHFEHLLEEATPEDATPEENDTSSGTTEPNEAYEEKVPEETPPPVIEEEGIAEEQPAEKPEPPKEVPVVKAPAEKRSWWKMIFKR